MILIIRNNIFSAAVAIVILYLSLASTDNLDKISIFHFPGADKLLHAGMYFFFMTVIVIEKRKIFERVSVLLLISIIPLLYGGLMEILQSMLTVNREGSILDFFSNGAGIFLSVAMFLLYRKFRLSDR
jgi:VanZ family protein